MVVCGRPGSRHPRPESLSRRRKGARSARGRGGLVPTSGPPLPSGGAGSYARHARGAPRRYDLYSGGAMQRYLMVAGLVAIGSGVAVAAVPENTAMFHERKEIAGLAVVFGAEPEPAITEEMQFLRWRISSLADEEPFTELQDAQVTITRGGDEFGPFPLRGSRRDPGLYQTQHIFTAEGEYESVMTFRKGEETETHTIDFTFRIRDRASLEIPPRRRGGR